MLTFRPGLVDNQERLPPLVAAVRSAWRVGADTMRRAFRGESPLLPPRQMEGAVCDIWGRDPKAPDSERSPMSFDKGLASATRYAKESCP